MESNTSSEFFLYDYVKIILRRKKMIAGIFILITGATLVLNLLMTKIYEGEILLRIATIREPDQKFEPKPILTGKELVQIFSRVNQKKNQISKDIHEIKVHELRGSTDKVKLIVQSENPKEIPSIVSDFLKFASNVPEIKLVEQQIKEHLQTQIVEIGAGLKRIQYFREHFDKKINGGKIDNFGFNPIEIDLKFYDLTKEKNRLENEYKSFSFIRPITSLDVSESYVRPQILRNTILAALFGIILGLFVAFVAEYPRQKRAAQISDPEQKAVRERSN